MWLNTILAALALAPALAATGISAGWAAPMQAVAPLRVAKPSGSALFNAAYLNVGGDWEKLILLCDGIDGDRIRIVRMPNARGLSQLWTYRKRDFRPVGETVRLGDEDPGAGQIMRELRRPGGAAIGSVHSINPGLVGDAAATSLPTLSSVTLGGATTRCRWMPRGRVLYVDAKRTVLITSERDGRYTYRSYDHAKPGNAVHTRGNGATSVATATVTGGRLVRSRPGEEAYEFLSGPWTYRLTASADNRAPGATITVLRSGKTKAIYLAVAYEMAAARIE